MNPDLTFHEAVERLAYEIYEQEGRPDGRALDHWRKAEEELGDDRFLEQELENEEFEGGLVPRP